MEAALATGARAVAVATGSYPAADLVAAGAHVVLPDLTDAARGAGGRHGFPPGGGSRPRSIAVVTAAVRPDCRGRRQPAAG